MKKNLLVFLLTFLSVKFLDAQSAFVDMIGTGGDQFTYIPPPPQFSSGLRSATFTITFNGYTSDAQTAFQFAADIWSSILISNIPIKVNTYFTPLLPGILGITLPNGRKNFQGAPIPNSWYASCLANAIADSELNAGEQDFDLYLNSSINWYFGTDGNCPAGKYDFVTTALHEMCHGLGFVGLGNSVNNLGSFGLITASDFAPTVTSFPFPDLEGLPGVYDQFLYDIFDDQLASTLLFPNNSSQLNDAFTSNTIFFEGINAINSNNGVNPRIYAPPAFSLGSSLVHLDESTYPAGNINDLMTPSGGTAEVTHDPGPIAVGALKDIGWNVNYNVGVEEVNSKNNSMKIFPDPVRNQLTVSGFQSVFTSIEISDVMEKKIIDIQQPQFPLDVSDLPEGIFFCKVKTDNQIFSTKFIKQ